MLPCTRFPTCSSVQVVPVLLQLTRSAEDLQRRVDMVRALTDLVVLQRQHVRKFLPDLLALVNDFWGTAPAMLPHILSLLAELSRASVPASQCSSVSCPPASLSGLPSSTC